VTHGASALSGQSGTIRKLVSLDLGLECPNIKPEKREE
jgi:hypothetical protein